MVPTTERALIDLETRSWEALAVGGEECTTFYDEILDAEPVILMPGGLVLRDRATVVKSMGGPPWTDYRLEEMSVIELSPDAAVITYGAVARRNGQARPYSAFMSSIYVRRYDGWKLAMHQQTPR
jgi:hypothetical protein